MSALPAILTALYCAAAIPTLIHCIINCNGEHKVAYVLAIIFAPVLGAITYWYYRPDIYDHALIEVPVSNIILPSSPSIKPVDKFSSPAPSLGQQRSPRFSSPPFNIPADKFSQSRPPFPIDEEEFAAPSVSASTTQPRVSSDDLRPI